MSTAKRAPRLGSHRIRRTSQYENLRSKGKRLFVNSWMLFNYASSTDGISRYGWTVPRGAGRAVDRNRFKRWIREFFQECLNERQSPQSGLQLTGCVQEIPAHEMQVALYAPKGVVLGGVSRAEFREALKKGFRRSIKGLEKSQ